MFQFHKKDVCPLCNKKAQEVSAITIDSIVKKENRKNLSSLEGFYFCENQICKAVYFKEQIIITQNNLIKTVGLKDGTKPETICYCFNWTKEKIIKELILDASVDIVGKINKKRENSECQCERKNPSGKCCLDEVKQAIDKLKVEYIF